MRTQARFFPGTSEELKTAVRNWHKNEQKAIADYGDISGWDVSNIVDMSYLFHGLPVNGDISQWNVSKVEDTSHMFEGSPFNGSISQWEVSKVRNMSYMFRNSSFNGNISEWKVSGVRNMSYMFAKSKFNGNISKWKVSAVKDMSYMFGNSSFKGDISEWNVSQVTNMCGMFCGSRFTGNISNWNVSKVESMEYMFQSSLFNRSISNWDVSQVKSMRYMFAQSPFNGDISSWDVARVVNMSSMFFDSSFNRNISEWNVSSVLDMSYMFQSSPFNGDISWWKVSGVVDMRGMFKHSHFNGDVSSWDVSAVKHMAGMFEDAPFSNDPQKEQDILSTWDFSRVTDQRDMFVDSSFTGTISRWFPWFGSGGTKKPSATQAEASQNLGVSLNYLLDHFSAVADEATKGIKTDPTFNDLKEAYWVAGRADFHDFKNTTCLRDGQPGCSFVDCLERQGHAAKATHYLSWSWGYKVSDFVSALREWAKGKTDEERGDIFIWICFFTCNQVRIIMRQPEGQQITGSDELEAVFKNRLKDIGKMLILFDNFTDPLYVKRVWCVYETFIASTTEGVDIEVVLPEVASKKLPQTPFEQLARHMASINVEQAIAFEPSDADKIKEQIRKSCGGYEAVNTQVKHFLATRLGTIFAAALLKSACSRSASRSPPRKRRRRV